MDWTYYMLYWVSIINGVLTYIEHIYKTVY